MCRKAFTMFDKDGTGTIDVRELKTALIALGQQPTDEELFVMISQASFRSPRHIYGSLRETKSCCTHVHSLQTRDIHSRSCVCNCR